MIILKAKNEKYAGVISGITFINGVGQVEKLSDLDRKWFKKYDFEIIEEKPTEEGNKEIIVEEEVINEETTEGKKKPGRKPKEN